MRLDAAFCPARTAGAVIVGQPQIFGHIQDISALIPSQHLLEEAGTLGRSLIFDLVSWRHQIVHFRRDDAIP